MSVINKFWIVLTFSSIGFGAFAGTNQGWGLSNVRNNKTMAQVKRNCPDYYQSRDGRCLNTTFRSYLLLRTVRGGGFGSGK
ncbi:MAG: hypothetical protein AAFU33_15320 [Bacteroidota bacterium]